MLGPLSWVLIYTADIPAMRDFYGRVLGLPVKRDGAEIVVFETGSCTLELMGKLANGPDAIGPEQGWARNKILASFHVADIEAQVAAIEARGATSLWGIRPTMSPPGVPPRGRLAQFMDPDGNIIEICDVPIP